ncbi:GNAT family N-acetyltransferase [Marimonas lutisalis]|uniref:GNAT family N-acetyltransferase n=1 Tax=Marimonas lutisalis TaxID=2545756 RepID=UPI0010F926C8|nr:N-acetyltransferase [Marimonas lutisalis]
MEFSDSHQNRADDIIALFTRTFTASEGADEGRLIGALVQNLLATTPPDDLLVFSAIGDGTLLGCIAFTRLRYDQDHRVVFLLSPVAVAPDRQGQGIGQALLNHGLDALRQRGVDVAITYGNPAYYSRVGFHQITEDVARAPQPLGMPIGWLAQSLGGDRLTPLRGTAHCAPALDHPDYW